MNGTESRANQSWARYPNPQRVQLGLSGPGAEVLRQIAQLPVVRGAK